MAELLFGQPNRHIEKVIKTQIILIRISPAPLHTGVEDSTGVEDWDYCAFRG
jgi:hypothetical protein